MNELGSVSVSEPDLSKPIPRKKVLYQLKMVPCGNKRCKSCPHGPYWYKKWWEGKHQMTKYIGIERPNEITPEMERELLASMPVKVKVNKKKASKGKISKKKG